MTTLLQDLRYGIRMLMKNPGFTAVAVLTLALGIGANTAMFTVIRAVVLKPLAYHDPDRLARVSADYPRRNLQDLPLSRKRFEEMRAAARSFTGLGAYLNSPENVILSGGGEPEALRGARVSANFLDILGVQPVVGRSFLSEEDTRGGPPVAMISAELWQRRFGGDRLVAGKTSTLNSTPYTIVGVLPAGFAFPFPGVDVWVTRPAESSALPPRYWDFVPLLTGFARLKPGVSLEQARAEMDVLNQQYAMTDPGNSVARMRVAWLKDALVANVRPLLWMLFAAVGFVLLIACANVASLLLARATSRSREFALRAALGASRGRLIRQLLAESLVLAVAGGALGVLLAKWSLSAGTHLSALDLPRIGEIRMDSVVLGFSVTLSVATGVLFGLFPSLQVSRPDLIKELRESGASAGQGSSGRRGVLGLSTRGVLVAGQIALSIVLLIGAALLMESIARLRHVDPGLKPENLLTMKIALPLTRYDTDQKKTGFFDELVRRVEAVPGVRGAATALSLPTTRGRLSTNIQVEGEPDVDPSKQPMSQLQSITPGYFRTLGIPVQHGREFAARDNSAGAPPVVIINESFARRFWPTYPRGREPVGQHLREGADRTGWLEIVGIVGDVHETGLAMDAGPEFYVPSVMHPPQTAYLAVRTDRDPLGFVNVIRSQVLAIDRDQPVSDVKTMDNVLEASVGQRRLTMLLLTVFAGVALLLATVGIYGVIAYSVAQRTKEVGIRRALGAQQGHILRLVLGQGLVLALGGVGIGMGGAFALTRLMEGLLFHTRAADPATFVGVAVLFVAVALLASYIPARRAAKVDPMVALRYE